MKRRITPTWFFAGILFVSLSAGCRAEHRLSSKKTGDGGEAPIFLTDSNFEAHVLQSDIPVLVDFWASRCPPCLEMKPEVRELVAAFRGRATIAEIDVDANPQVPKRLGVRDLPCVLIFREGKVVSRLEGLQTKDSMSNALSGVVAKSERHSAFAARFEKDIHVTIDEDRDRRRTYKFRDREQFAELIREYGVRGAREALARRVSLNTLGKIAKEFAIDLKTGNRPRKAA